MFHPAVGSAWDGAASIRKNFAGLLKDFDPDIALHSVRSESSGTLAYDSGTYDETIAPINTAALDATDLIRVNSGSTVKDVAEYLGVPVPDVIKQLFCSTAVDLQRDVSFQSCGLVDLMAALTKV